jgi:hypothetical protein
MQAYQSHDVLETPGIAKLRQFVARELDDKPGRGNYQEFEKRLHSLVAECEREFLGKKLASYDIVAEAIQVGGVVYKPVLRSSQTYIAAAGNITVERNLYRSTLGGRCICPLELRAGIIEGLWTPLAARHGMFAMAQLTSEECETLFDELGNMRPSHSSLDRLPKRLSERWEEHRADWEDAVRSEEPIPERATIVAIGLDGLMVPMKPSNVVRRSPAEAKKIAKSKAAKAGEKGGKKEPKPTVYKEASCGTVSFFDREGDRLETVYCGRMPEHKKVALTDQLRDEYLSIVQAVPGIQPVFLADGASENWRFLETLTEVPGKMIVDIWHAYEHLKKGLDAFYGVNATQSRAEFERLKVILKEQDGGVDQVIRALKYRHNNSTGAAKKDVLEQLTYFRNQRSRMDYASYLRDNLPVGSGITEAGCKTVYSPRLKRSGQSWTLKGGQGIVTFRCLIKSKRWATGWKLVANSYKTRVTVLEDRHGHSAAVGRAA